VRRDGTVARDRWTAAGLLALFVLVYLWPVLVQGKVLAPTAGLYYNTPWSDLAPRDLGAYVNRQIEDATLSFYPWQVLARQLIRAGTFPAWNPHALAGTPFFTNPEVAWFSPFSALLWLLPLNHALGLVAALKLWLAGFGTYLLVRELRLGFWPALLAGVSFALCAFDVVWLAHGVQVSEAALLPWTLWLVERVTQRGRGRDALLLVGLVVLVLAGGHPGTQLHVLSAGALYAIVRTVLARDVGRRERLRRLGLVGAALALGVLVSAIALLPAQQGAIGTAGAFSRRNGSVEFQGSHLPFGVLRTVLFPDWWGRPRFALGPGPADYNERTFYAGAVALVLAVLALGSAGGWRRKAPFALLAAIGVAVPVRAPGIEALVRHLPLFDLVQNQRMVLWLLMAVAVLAAFGLQSVLDAPRRRAAWVALGAAVLAALVAVATIGPGGAPWRAALHAFLHRAPKISEPAPAVALASVGWWSVFVAGLGAVLLLARLRPARRQLAGGLVVLLAALDMLHFAHGYQPMAPASKAVPPVTPAIAYLQRHAGDGRIAALTYDLLTDFSTVYGLRDARGYDQPQPSLAFYRLWQAAVSPQQTFGGAYLVPGATPTSVRLLGALGARYLVDDPGASSPNAGVLPTVYRGRDATIFENRYAMTRAVVPAYVYASDSEAQQITTLTEARFDPRNEVVVSRSGLGAAAAGAANGTGGRAGSVRVVGERNAQVTLRARVPRPQLVVLDDAWAPGWSVTVDGRPARALQPDVVLRGVVVPAGEHTIVWSYRVPGLRLGAELSGLGLLVAAAWGASLIVLGRRRARLVAAGDRVDPIGADGSEPPTSRV
jgi:hypothetical protein